MPKSPFLGRDNAILTFNVSTGKMKYNSRGNAIPETEEITVKCYLISNKKSQIYEPGVDQNQERMNGYAVEPMHLPPEIQDGDKAKAKIGNYTGDFILKLDTIETPEFLREAGTKFSGVFIRH